MSKRIAIVFLCLAIAMMLCACSKPFGGTPYESLGSWDTDGNEVPDAPQSNVVISGNSSTTDTGASSTTATNGQSTISTPSTSTKQPVVSGGTTSASATQQTTGGTSSEGAPTGTTTTIKPTTTNTAAVEDIQGVQLPAEGYSQNDGKLVVSKVSLQGNTVTMEFENRYKNFQTEDTSSIDYVCYDKDGKELSVGKLAIGILKSGEKVSRSFELAKDTDRVELINWKIPFWTEGWF